jgi:hypothetical protein
MNEKQKNALLTKLANAAAAAAAKDRFPILRGPHRTPDGLLHFTDLDCWLSLPVPAGIPADAPGIYSPEAWKMLKAGLPAAPGIEGNDPADLPPVPGIAEGDAVTDPVETSPDLWEAVRAVLPVASTDETRCDINGALIYPPDGGKPSMVAATDGRRAHIVEIAHDLPLQCLGVPSSGLFKAFQDAAGRDGETVTLLSWHAPAGPSHTVAVWGDVVCVWKDTGNIPPNIRQVIPSEADTDDPHPISGADTKALSAFRKAAGTKNTASYNLVTCTAHAGYGDASYAVPGAVPLALMADTDPETGAVSGVETAPVFNPAYLEALAAFAGDASGDLGLRLSRPIREGGVHADSLTEDQRRFAPKLTGWGPALAVRGNRKAVLMPMRVE